MQTQPTHPTIVVATDDARFSDRLTELLLRADVRTIRFARCDDAVVVIRDLLPDMVILHVPREQLHIGWECCEQLQLNPQTAAIPVLVYAPFTPPSAGQDGRDGGSDTTSAADSLLTRMTALIAPAEQAPPAEDSTPDLSDALPLGRNDL
jgi:response regulator RpfG family c-di-GMP phosphodiesterase